MTSTTYAGMRPMSSSALPTRTATARGKRTTPGRLALIAVVAGVFGFTCQAVDAHDDAAAL